MNRFVKEVKYSLRLVFRLDLITKLLNVLLLPHKRQFTLLK